MARIYSVDTTSGVGTLSAYTATPDKLAGDGFLVDYVQFVKDVNADVSEYVPSRAKAAQVPRSEQVTLPHPGRVY